MIGTTAKDFLVAILNHSLGERIRYAPVDYLKAIALYAEIEQRQESTGEASSFYAALEAAAEMSIQSDDPDDY